MSRIAVSGVLSSVRDEGDRMLVLGLKRGDRAAFEATYQKYRARIHGFLARLAGRRDVAEDLFQEVWMKLARHAPRLLDDTDLPAWLFTVARNAYASHRRWTMLDLSRLVALADEVQSEGTLESALASMPDRDLESARSLVRLDRALASLSTADREVLLLVGVEELDQEQAAAILSVRYDAFRQRLTRARTRLARALEKLGDAPLETKVIP